MQITRLYHDLCPTPLGPLAVVTTDTQPYLLDFGEWQVLESTLKQKLKAVAWEPKVNPLGLCTRIQAYFAGDLTALNDLPLLIEGTPFQRRVWAAVQQIPIGTTMTYGALATQLSQPTASRAVGMAVGRNRMALLIPCHRVVGTTGKLTGYAWGLDRKRWLLHHEAPHSTQT